MVSAVEIEREVFKEIEICRPRVPAVRRDHRLIADLRLASDDATSIALALERKFRVRIPREEWGLVSTVQDVINLLARHASGSPIVQDTVCSDLASAGRSGGDQTLTMSARLQIVLGAVVIVLGAAFLLVAMLAFY